MNMKEECKIKLVNTLYVAPLSNIVYFVEVTWTSKVSYFANAFLNIKSGINLKKTPLFYYINPKSNAYNINVSLG